MAIDVGIYANLLRPPKSVAEYDAEAQQQQQNALALSTGRIANQNALRDQQESNDYRQAAKGFGTDSSANYNMLLQRGLPTQAAAYQKSALEGQKTQGEIAMNKSHAGLYDADAQAKIADAKYTAAQRHAQEVVTLQTPQDVAGYLATTAEIMGIPPEQRQAIIQQGLQKAQQMGLEAWKAQTFQAAIPAVERFKTDAENARNAATNQTSRANNADTNKTHIQTTGMTVAQSERSSIRADSRARETAAGEKTKAPSGYRFTADGSLEAIPGGPAALKVGGEASKVADAKDVLSMLDQAEPLLNKATSSFVGKARDMAGRAVNVSTEGAQASAELKALEGALVSKMPKMSGPQSDKDVLLYRQMAGQIGDETIPAETKRAAMRTIRTLNERYAGQSKPAAPAAGAHPAEISDLLKKYGGK